MKEQACQFGEQRRLSGIVTLPEDDKSRVGLILISAGLTAKVGPYRLYTELARDVAKTGICTLRFDLGGIGNSEQIYAGYPLKVRTQLDITEAADYLESAYGITNLVVGGLCSGAEDALRYAYDDSRVSGVILLDGHGYSSSDKKSKPLNGRTIIRWIGSLLKKLDLYKYVMGSAEESSLEGVQGLVDYQQMELVESTHILNTLIARPAELLYVYTRRFRHSLTRKEQFAQMFPQVNFKDQVTVSCLPHMEHTQVFEEDRRELVDTISQWLSSRFPQQVLVKE
ncbi:MAG: alpha/beta hydrolase [Cyclobacteriaceae bacterium]|nr:alpha/beta hydrolase [Cyclobacteriaceae bacterium]